MSSPLYTNTDSGVHLGLAFDSGVTDPTTLHPLGVDYVWGGSWSKFDPGFRSDFYLPYDRDTDATHSLAYWNGIHPDWVVYACDQVTPAYEFGDGNIPLDITNPGVVAYQMSSVRFALGQGFNGIGWDNVRLRNESARCGVWRNGQWVALYSGNGIDTTFQTDVINWLHTVRDQTKALNPNAAVAVNLSIDGAIPDASRRLGRYFDMAFDESGFTWWGSRHLTGADWIQELTTTQSLDSYGKAVVLAGIEPGTSPAAVSPSDVEWVLSNYLMAKGHHTYTNIYARDDPSGMYGQFFDRPEYHIAIGTPTSAAASIQNVYLYQRSYSGGMVVVNASPTQTFTVSLPGGMYSLSGQPTSSITLPPGSGRVLLAH